MTDQPVNFDHSPRATDCSGVVHNSGDELSHELTGNCGQPSAGIDWFSPFVRSVIPFCELLEWHRAFHVAACNLISWRERRAA